MYQDTHDKMIIISLWGFVMAQLGWVFWIWNVIYTLPAAVFSIPLIALIASILSYAAGSIYHANSESKITNKFITQQLLFVCGIVLLVIIFTPWTGQI